MMSSEELRTYINMVNEEWEKLRFNCELPLATSLTNWQSYPDQIKAITEHARNAVKEIENKRDMSLKT